MRFVLAAAALASVAAIAAPPAASAADMPRRGAYARSYAEAPPPPRGRRVIVEQLAGENLTIVDVDDVVLKKGYIVPEPPRRVERRVYMRPGDRGPEYSLYGGFYGLDRWGAGRGTW